MNGARFQKGISWVGSICNIKRVGVLAVDSEGGIAFIVRMMRTGLND